MVLILGPMRMIVYVFFLYLDNNGNFWNVLILFLRIDGITPHTTEYVSVFNCTLLWYSTRGEYLL